MDLSGSKRGDKDSRFDLSIDPELIEKVEDLIDLVQELAKDRPLATVKFCYETQKKLQLAERSAAMRANTRFHISWAKISRVFARPDHWAWDRYVASGLSHPKSRRRSTE